MSEAPAGQRRGGSAAGVGGCWRGCTAQLVPGLLPAALLLVKQWKKESPEGRQSSH